MLQKHAYGNITWIDIENPTPDDLKIIVDDYGINHIVANELVLPTVKPRVERHSNYLYAILHFPKLNHVQKSTEQEIDFLVGNDFIITVRYETIEPMKDFSKVVETAHVLEQDKFTPNAGILFHYMIKRMYKAINAEIDFVKAELKRVEDGIFTGHEKEMVFRISDIARNIIDIKQSLNPQEEMLRTFETESKEFFGKDFRNYAHAITDDYYRSHRKIVRLQETLRELRETNNSLLTTKQNEVMRIFTILAFVTFPLSLVAAVFGMNATHMPIVGSPYDFWLIVGVMGFATLIMFLYFKHKRWI